MLDFKLKFVHAYHFMYSRDGLFHLKLDIYVVVGRRDFPSVGSVILLRISLDLPLVGGISLQ